MIRFAKKNAANVYFVHKQVVFHANIQIDK